MSSMNLPTNLPPLFEHQQATVDFYLSNPRALNISDAGTGKTRATLEAWARVKKKFNAGRLLVLAPLSILRPAWANDCAYWTPGLSTTIAYHHCREEAFQINSDIVVMNHDGVHWLNKNREYLDGFDGLVIDEFTAFKNPNSDRSEALRDLREYFHVRWLLSGTPTPNSVTDIWFPTYICDDGERLGKSFAIFRKQVCDAHPIPGVAFGKNWIDKEDAQDIVADRLRDIAIRYRFDECIDIPPNHMYTRWVEMDPETERRYNEMLRESVVELENGDLIEAVHAGARVQKMLQILSGAVYDGEKLVHTFSTSRYELVADLADSRNKTLIGFLWQHQKEAIAAALKKRGVSYAIIDGSASPETREQAVHQFQNGDLRVILAHPQSAGHGLTLTSGQTTIWASPTYNAEHFVQFNARVPRAGQKQKTETILVTARNSWEEYVYEKLNTKVVRQSDLLALLKHLYEIRTTQ